MRLYTADAIKEQVHKLLCEDCGETDYCPNCDYRELIEQILDAPTVDAEPVVRCKECNWFERNNTKKGEVLYCYYHEMNIKEDDFCSWGERKEDAEH